MPLASMAFTAFVLGPSPAFAQVSLGAAQEFAVLAGSAVTCTDSMVTGDVGIFPGTAVTQTSCTISGTVHVADAAAQQASIDFLTAYDAIAALSCEGSPPLTVLSGLTLPPGVYCVSAAATETGGVLTLNGPSDGVWIFKIGTGGTGALTGTNFTVLMPGGQTCNNNVFWWTAQAATLTDSTFIGTILAGTSITITRGTFDGQALAKVAVTMTGTQLCGGQPQPAIQFQGSVTGGGQIAVPDPASPGRASFGFNAKGNDGGTASGHFNYLNHVTGLHVNGPVNSVVVSVTNPDGSPNTIRFSGTCDGNLPACSFVVTVQDNGEPGTSDQFGVTVTGGVSETTSQRVISNGNIQFHLK